MSAADDLRALTAVATPGPWETRNTYRGKVAATGWGASVFTTVDPSPEWISDSIDRAAKDAELIVWLRNHADALADLIAAVGEMPIHGSDPAVSYCFICKNDAPCPTERAQLAVAALEADRG